MTTGLPSASVTRPVMTPPRSIRKSMSLTSSPADECQRAARRVVHPDAQDDVGGRDRQNLVVAGRHVRERKRPSASVFARAARRKRCAAALQTTTTVTPATPRSPSVTRPATVAGASLCARPARRERVAGAPASTAARAPTQVHPERRLAFRHVSETLSGAGRKIFVDYSREAVGETVHARGGRGFQTFTRRRGKSVQLTSDEWRRAGVGTFLRARSSLATRRARHFGLLPSRQST